MSIDPLSDYESTEAYAMLARPCEHWSPHAEWRPQRWMCLRCHWEDVHAIIDLREALAALDADAFTRANGLLLAWSHKRRGRAVKMRNSGMSFVAIGAALGVSRERARQIVRHGQRDL